MKYLKHLICMVMMLFLLLPGAAASESKGEGVNLQEILWGTYQGLIRVACNQYRG